MRRKRLLWFLLLCSVVIISPPLASAQAESSTEGADEQQQQASASASASETTAESTPPPKKESSTSETSSSTTSDTTKKVLDDDFDVQNEDWGTYYDPQGVFCGKYDCYKILGFDYEAYGKQKPDRKTITKRYRALSREWHPDKSKHRHAKSKFVKIARAYEVLTDEEQRKEYDMMRYNQEAYFQKYGTSVLWSYAPKSDVSMVLLIIFVVANLFSWQSQRHRWQLVADRLTQAAVEDWSPSQGGTEESKLLREEAMAILATEQEKKGADESNNKAASPSNSKKKGGKKLSGKEKKRQEQEALLPIVKKLVNEMHDFGGGFHKPTWRDLFAVTLVRLPYKLTVGTAWQIKYWIRRLQGKELNDEEKEVLTERAVGPVVWDTSSDEVRQEMISRELWISDNKSEWQEEQEVKKMSAADQKMYNKLKKKGKLDKLE